MKKLLMLSILLLTSLSWSVAGGYDERDDIHWGAVTNSVQCGVLIRNEGDKLAEYRVLVFLRQATNSSGLLTTNFPLFRPPIEEMVTFRLHDADGNLVPPTPYGKTFGRAVRVRSAFPGRLRLDSVWFVKDHPMSCGAFELGRMYDIRRLHGVLSLEVQVRLLQDTGAKNLVPVVYPFMKLKVAIGQLPTK